MPTVTVKWQKQVFENVEIDTSEPPCVFKCQLFELTGVPPDRQKIMVKGGLLKDDVDWLTLGVKEGQKLMMMGTADEVFKTPDNGTVFIEDLPENEKPVVLGHTAGLLNLGNTCYMNSTLQCLHSIPELKSTLVKYLPEPGRSGEGADQSSHLLTCATRDLFNELDRSAKPVAPMQFWMVLRKKYPQFGQLHKGSFMQQDAEECWTQLLYALSQSLKQQQPSATAGDVIKELFGIELISKVRCTESGEESIEKESVYALKCHISQAVNHLQEGLKQGLRSELEKASPSLGRSAVHVRESRIGSLPGYLTVQFVRFFWKRESSQKAKILRKVSYPLELDVYDICSDELQAALAAPRQLLRDERKSGSSPLSSGPPETPTSSGSITGIYDLVAVVTHKGRSADSGHYVAWVKHDHSCSMGKWWEFDDDSAVPQREEDITRLCGGGDWHMAYICIYKSRSAHV